MVTRTQAVSRCSLGWEETPYPTPTLSCLLWEPVDNKQEAAGEAGGPHAFSLPCLFPGDSGSLLRGRERWSPPTMTHHCVVGLVFLQPTPTQHSHTLYSQEHVHLHSDKRSHIHIHSHMYTRTNLHSTAMHSHLNTHSEIFMFILTHPQIPSDAHTSASVMAHTYIHKNMKKVQYMK